MLDIFLWTFVVLVWAFNINMWLNVLLWQKKVSNLMKLTESYCKHKLQESLIHDKFDGAEADRRRIWYYGITYKLIDDKYTLIFGTYWYFTRNIFDYYFQGEFREDLLDYVKTVHRVDPTSPGFRYD